MNITTITHVRNHLYRLSVGEGEIRNHAVRIYADEYSGLAHAHLSNDSETVKSLTGAVPLSETIVLADDPVSLQHQHLVPDSVVCATDSSLSMVYQENVDYTVDYASGNVMRIDGGVVSKGSEVTVWYLFYHVYQRDVDYYIDYQRGRLRRTTSGNIEEGQELLVDYRLGTTEFADSEIEQCIVEAEAEIMLLIDPIWQESTDPALQAAATFLTLSLLCRNAVSLAAAGTGSDVRASNWLELSESYRQTATRLLTWFTRETPGLSAPRLA
jgi:hypothetical protein